MHTGYDNYWMYHNRRHEPLLCNQKNDSFRHPVYTDRYKQVQGKANPNSCYNSAPHYPNTHHNVPNDQHRMTSTQSMLPSSVCLQPYPPPPLTHNYHPSEACSIQPNDMHDSLHSLQNQVLRNMHYNPGQTANYKASVGPAGCNYRTPTSSIRVKDFSLLNNNKNNNCNSLLVSGSQQAQQKKPWYYLNDSAESVNKPYDDQSPRVCTNYTGLATSDVSSSYQNYGSPSASHNFHPNNAQHCPQSSTAYYHPTAQLSCERQICYNNLQQRSGNACQDFSSGNYPPPPRTNLDQDVIQEADEPGTLPSPGRQSGARAYNIACALPEGDEIDADPQTQLVAPDNRLDTLRSLLMDKIRSRESPSIRTVPSTAQNAGDSTLSENSSLPSSNSVSATCREDVIDTRGSEVSAAGRGMKKSEKRSADKQDEGDKGRERREDEESVWKSEVDSDCQVVPKIESEENLGSECENTIGMEEVESPIKSGIECFAGEDDREQREETETAADFLFPEKPETASGGSNPNEESDVVVLEEVEGEVEAQTVDLTEDNKSKINRDKLNLLMEFLKKDGGEPVEVVTIKEDNSPPPTKPQDEKIRKQNRRKLSKTSVVKNKNTEREMITLVSLKTPKSSSPKSGRDAAEEKGKSPENNSESLSKSKQAEETDEEKPGALIKPEEERKPPKETTDNYPWSGKGITREERNVINIMRAFQNLKKHFCASCDFVSPVESIWINVVSGELRCLNCFKKMMTKADESGKKGSADAGVDKGELGEREKNLEKKWGDLKRGVKEEKEDSCERKKSESMEGLPRKVKVPKEEEDVKQSKTISGERRSSKCLSSPPKSRSPEESKKQESSVKPKGSHSSEKHAEEKHHKREQSKTKEKSSEQEQKMRKHHSSEKHTSKRKSTGSVNETDVKKIRTAEESSKETSEKRRRESKENIYKNKACGAEGEERDSGRKHSESKEHSQSPETNDGEVKKAIKLLSSPGSLRKRRKRERKDSVDPTYSPPWLASSGGEKPSKTSRKKETASPKPHLPKIPKKDSRHEHPGGKSEEKHEHSGGKNDDKREHTPGKHFPQKTPIDSGRSIHAEHLKHSKQCLISKLFKGKQTTQVSPNSKLLDKEPRKVSEHKKEHARDEEKGSGANAGAENRCRSLPKTPHRTPGSDPHKR